MYYEYNRNLVRNYIYALGIVLTIGLLGIKEASAQNTDADGAARISLNGDWYFKIDPNQEGESSAWFADNIDICSWDSMAVPGNWDLENRYADYVGKAWYRRRFRMPDNMKDKALRLVFESTSYYAKFWLNGKYLGKSQLGFLPRYFDIKSAIRYGEDNILAVEIDNTFKLGALWNWGGIRRPVWIEITDPQRLDYQHITAVPDLKEGDASVNIKVKLENQSGTPKQVDLKYAVRYKGKTVREAWQRNIRIGGHQEIIRLHNFKLSKKEVRLWDFDHPHLYESKVILYNKEGREIHSLKDRFGIRKIEIDGYALKLNGQVIRPVGFNLVPDDRTNGNTLPLWRIKQDVDMMKSLGANMARISHLALPEDFLDYLDRRGMLVFSEVSLWGKNRMVNADSLRPKKWLEKLIKIQYNHPCIIGWSVGNEIGYLNQNPGAMGYVQSAISHAKQLDSNRLAVYVSHSASTQEKDPVKYADILLLNKYNNWGAQADQAHQYNPKKPVFYAEFGEHIVDEDPNKGIINASKMLNEMRGKEYLIGASLWTFNDYRSNYTGTGASENRAWGVVNAFRQPKRAFDTFKREFAPVEKLNIAAIKDKEDRIRQLDIIITPRSILGIPAYALKGYKVIWQILDGRGKIAEGGLIKLPDMYPGGNPFSTRLLLQNPLTNGDGKVKVSLVSPQMYAVLDTTIYLVSPSAPQIKAVYSSSKAVRVVYDKVPNAEYYRMVYSDGEEVDTTKGSIDGFIEINNLKRNKKYIFNVIAENDYGTSRPSSTVTAKLSEDELPPVIWKSAPSNHSFFVGYSSVPDDIFYEIEYGTSPGNYSHKLIIGNKGALKVSGLENGQSYYYRLRSVKQWGFKSEWSPEHIVIPDGGLKPPPPEINGIIESGTEAIICFKPVSKAIGYSIIKKYADGTDKEIFTDAARIQYIKVSELDSVEAIYMRAVNQYGVSKKVRVKP